jgi:outer membrane lipoprotein-sorting protein
MRLLRPINRRWAVPAAALAVVLGVGAVPQLIPSAGASTPDLPTLTPAELLAKARTSQVGAFSGDVQLVSDMGLPSLSGLAGGAGSTLTDLASGTHSAHVWFDGPEHVRIALPSSLAESDWIRNGTDLWSWDSRTQEATHTTVAAHGGADAADAAKDPPGATPSEVADVAAETPAQFAQRLLADVTPSTLVTVRTPTYVADQAVYELSLAPRSPTSTVQEAVIAVDAATGLPLDVTIIAKGSSSPAFEFGFTHVNFAKPAASEFAFTPPHGASVIQATSPTGMLLGRRHHDHFKHAGPLKPGALAVPVPPPPGPDSQSVRRLGEAWDSIVILTGQRLDRLDGLLSSATRVGTGATAGRLVTTKLVNVLLLDDGRILAGAVTPAALEAAAAR